MSRSFTEVAYVGLDFVWPISFVHCEDVRGRTLIQKSLARHLVIPWISKLPRCTVSLEASTAIHGVAARLADYGHRVMLISSRDLTDGPGDAGPKLSRAKMLCRATQRTQSNALPVRTLEEMRCSAAQKIRALLSRQRMTLLRAARILLDDFGREPFIGVRDLDRLRGRLDDLANTGEAGQAAESLSAVLSFLDDQMAHLGEIGAASAQSEQPAFR